MISTKIKLGPGLITPITAAIVMGIRKR